MPATRQISHLRTQPGATKAISGPSVSFSGSLPFELHSHGLYLVHGIHRLHRSLPGYFRQITDCCTKAFFL